MAYPGPPPRSRGFSRGTPLPPISSSAPYAVDPEPSPSQQDHRRRGGDHQQQQQQHYSQQHYNNHAQEDYGSTGSQHMAQSGWGSRHGQYAAAQPPPQHDSYTGYHQSAGHTQQSYGDSGGGGEYDTHGSSSSEHLVKDLEGRVALAERSTRSLLKQALQAQSDIDESIQMSHDAYRGEKLLKEHIRSITYVVKTLSRELDVVEERALTATDGLRQIVRKLEKDQETAAGRFGWTQAQQEHVNARVREAVQVMTGELRNFQSRVSQDVHGISERLDSLQAKYSQTVAVQEAEQQRQRQINSELQAQLQQMQTRMDMMASQMEDSSGQLKFSQRVNQDFERRLAALTADFNSSINRERDWHTDERNKLGDLLMRRIDQASETDKQMREKLADELRRAIDMCVEDLERRAADDRQKFNQRIAVQREMTEQTLQEQKNTSETDSSRLREDVEGRCRALAENLEMLSSLLNQKTDMLEAKINKILKTVVII